MTRRVGSLAAVPIQKRRILLLLILNDFVTVLRWVETTITLFTVVAIEILNALKINGTSIYLFTLLSATPRD